MGLYHSDQLFVPGILIGGLEQVITATSYKLVSKLMGVDPRKVHRRVE